jgi:adsorption protein B
MQGWAHLGWPKGIAMRYMLFRDRRSLVTNIVGLLGYVIVAFVLTLQTYAWLVPEAYRYPPLVERGSWLWDLLVLNLGFLLNRVIWRVYSVRRIYGWKQGMLAIPRLVWSNFVNGCATSRAIYLYVRALVLGKKIGWDKTAHLLPAAFSQAPAEPLRLPFRSIDPEKSEELLHLVSFDDLLRFWVFPLELLVDGEILLATPDPPEPFRVAEIEAQLGRKVRFCLSTRADIAAAIRFGFRWARMHDGETQECPPDLATAGRNYPRIGDLLLEDRAITPDKLHEAVSRFVPSDGMRFGEFLVLFEYIDRAELEKALTRQELITRTESEVACAAPAGRS